MDSCPNFSAYLDPRKISLDPHLNFSAGSGSLVAAQSGRILRPSEPVNGSKSQSQLGSLLNPNSYLKPWRLRSWNLKSTKWCNYDVWIINYKYFTKWFKTSRTLLHTLDKIYRAYKDSFLGDILYICSYVCCVCIAVASSRTFQIPGS